VSELKGFTSEQRKTGFIYGASSINIIKSKLILILEIKDNKPSDIYVYSIYLIKLLFVN